VVLWFHGTLGARRQFPMLGRHAAENLGLRVIIVERPGTGLSDSYRYSAVTDWVADIAQVADALDAERLGVVGLSGGGAYALACGALPPLVDRVAAVAVLDGTVPSVSGPRPPMAVSPMWLAGLIPSSRNCAGRWQCSVRSCWLR
jgi:pimeloyl-ACP methyl ester carboxylesterase